MSTLKTHNLQSPDAGSVNIALTANAGMIVTGISTFNDRVNIGSLGVTTNFTVAGLSTFSDNVTIIDNKNLYAGTDNDLSFRHTGGDGIIKNTTGQLFIVNQGSNIILQSNNTTFKNAANNKDIAKFLDSSVELYYDNTKRFETTNTGAVVTGVLTATSFSGDGSSLSNLPAGAPVGGASTNTVFFENDKLVEVGYQITSTKNAMSAGPVSISAGIAVTVPSGCSWTIV